MVLILREFYISYARINTAAKITVVHNKPLCHLKK